MKRMGIFLIAVCLLFSGCAKKPSEENTAPATAPQTAPPTLSRETAGKNRMGAYREAVENFAYEHVFPDGSAAPVDSAFGSMEGNYFAIDDVDGDGERELLISFTAGPMASQVLYICGYDEAAGAVTVKLTEFPAVSFYEGGYVEAQLSHNQGLAGDAVWPYTLYQYQNGSFASAAFVDAWDVTLAEQDSSGQPFPADKDTDGDGIVFLVTQDETTKVLDGRDYESWRASLLDPDEPIPVTYYSVTRDNIREAFRE